MFRDIGNLAREFRRFVVAEQRKWAGLARMMARRAVAEEDWRDVAVEGHRFGFRGAVVSRATVANRHPKAKRHRQQTAQDDGQRAPFVAHGWSGRKQPTAGWVETGTGLRAMAASTALDSSWVVGAGRDRPN